MSKKPKAFIIGKDKEVAAVGWDAMRELEPGEGKVESYQAGDPDHPLLEYLDRVPAFIPPELEAKLEETGIDKKDVNLILAMGFENAKQFKLSGGAGKDDARRFLLVAREQQLLLSAPKKEEGE